MFRYQSKPEQNSNEPIGEQARKNFVFNDSFRLDGLNSISSVYRPGQQELDITRPSVPPWIQEVPIPV
jgi:hypothetical protein